jgi:hypothetical protein
METDTRIKSEDEEMERRDGAEDKARWIYGAIDTMIEFIDCSFCELCCSATVNPFH